MEQAEKRREKVNRYYFESGCYCIITKRIKKAAAKTSDQEAVAYYERACQCNRNYTN